MYFKRLKFMIILTLLLNSSSVLHSQTKIRTTGIGFRGSIWNMGNRSTLITFVEQNGKESIETGGFGGWLYFISRANDNWVLEFSLGAVAKVDGESFNYYDEEYDATLVIPILLGLQRDILSISNSSALKPYISFGGGPYWITEVKERARFVREEVVSTMKPGGFFGGGLHLMLGTIALNFDVKYHLVDFQKGNDYSGLEIGLGLSFMWGEYNPKTNSD